MALARSRCAECRVRLFQNKPPPLELVLVVHSALGSLVQHKICHFSNNFLNLFNTGMTLLRSSSGGFPNLSCNCVIHRENIYLISIYVSQFQARDLVNVFVSDFHFVAG